MKCNSKKKKILRYQICAFGLTSTVYVYFIYACIYIVNIIPISYTVYKKEDVYSHLLFLRYTNLIPHHSCNLWWKPLAEQSFKRWLETQ